MQIVPMNGKRVSGRELRRRLNAETAFLQEKAVPAINTALVNVGAVAERVTTLESRVNGVGALLARGFWGRLRWLVLGR